MDERQLHRRRPGMPQPARRCTGCGQPFEVAGTRVVWLRGTLHGFDRCAGCGRESGRLATVAECVTPVCLSTRTSACSPQSGRRDT
jgi:hypothetical protein